LNNGYQNLKVRACDDVNNCVETSVEINLISDRAANNQSFDVSLSSPSSGLAVNNIDFPLSINFSSTNPQQTARIEVYNKQNGTETLLGTIYPAGEKEASFQFKNPHLSGTYNLFGRAYGWSGQNKQTNEIILNVSAD
jgi:hypothetical protein